MTSFNAISLFTGAGGMDVGFEKAGVNVVFANEIMKELQKPIWPIILTVDW